mgnify:FL=1
MSHPRRSSGAKAKRAPCPVCRRTLPADCTGEVRCSRCDAVLDVESRDARLIALGRVPPALTVETEAAPGASYRNAGGAPAFVASKRWWKPDGITPLLLSVPMLAFVGWASQLRASGLAETFVMVATAVVCVGATVALWRAAAYVVNRATLSVSAAELRLMTGPIPWRGRRGGIAQMKDVRGVRAEPETWQQVVRNPDRTSRLATFTRWWRVVADTDRGPVTLMRHLDREEAHYLAERARRVAGLG